MQPPGQQSQAADQDTKQLVADVSCTHKHVALMHFETTKIMWHSEGCGTLTKLVALKHMAPSIWLKETHSQQWHVQTHGLST